MASIIPAPGPIVGPAQAHHALKPMLFHPLQKELAFSSVLTFSRHSTETISTRDEFVQKLAEPARVKDNLQIQAHKTHLLSAKIGAPRIIRSIRKAPTGGLRARFRVVDSPLYDVAGYFNIRRAGRLGRERGGANPVPSLPLTPKK